MTWDVRQRTEAGDRSAHVFAEWTGVSAVYDVELLEADGVRRVSMGGSSRREMRHSSKPVEGIYRWGEDVEAPLVIIRWREEQGGYRSEQEIRLGG